MTTLNARANQAWRDMEAECEQEDCVPNFISEQDAWEDGWETGYKAAAEEARIEVQRLTLTIRDLARTLRDEAYDTTDRSTKMKLVRIADEIGGAS